MSPTSVSDLVAGAPDALVRATDEAIDAARTRIERVRTGQVGSEALLDEYDEAMAALAGVRQVAALIGKAHPDPRLRSAADAAEQELDKVATDIALDRAVHDALAGVDLSGMDGATRHFVTKTLRDLRRAGVDRDDTTRERIRALQEELVTIGQDFARNINSDTRSARFPASALAGLPGDWVSAHPPDSDGMVTVTTDNPDVVPFLAYSHDADAREQMLRLWRQRGHPANVEVLRRMLRRRHELATVLGYPSWAAYITEDKMIGTAEAAAEFIAETSEAVRDRVRGEYAELLAQKRGEDPAASVVEPWDHRYLVERVKAERYAFDAQDLRPYFEYGRVKAGLLGLMSRLFGISFEPARDLPVWHPDVEAYEIRQGPSLLGRIYLDMHPRPDKFSHAAMFPMVIGKAGRRVPECALLCNLPRPGALLEFPDVRTFFHEFGHLVHHIVGGHQRWVGISGIRTERDFIEAPSQLLEEWTRDPATLATFAVHTGTGQPVPAGLVARMRAAEEFGLGLWAAQQAFYSALSLELYRGGPDVDPLAVERAEQSRHTPFPHQDGTSIHLSFGHLDGYSAIYYTYLWSMGIAKDLFTAFDPGDLLDPGVPARYRSAVLAAGGSAPAADLVRDFLGRDYRFDAFRSWLATEADSH
jgi:thimet oligopeptidase